MRSSVAQSREDKPLQMSFRTAFPGAACVPLSAFSARLSQCLSQIHNWACLPFLCQWPGRCCWGWPLLPSSPSLAGHAWRAELSSTPHHSRQEKALLVFRKALQAQKEIYELTSISLGKASLDNYLSITLSNVSDLHGRNHISVLPSLIYSILQLGTSLLQLS